MDQGEMFHEDFRDALRHAVKALGGVEAVGIELWPAKSRKAAGIWLSDCLNPERPAKLDLEEFAKIMRLARDRGIHGAMHHLCEDLGYQPPVTVEPLDQQAELQRQLKNLLDQAERITTRIERSSSSHLQAVR